MSLQSMPERERYDAIIIGGGFYGCCLALCLSHSAARVLIVEKEHDLLLRASFANQARVHNGYHYPRSFITALRSRVNFPRFVLDFRDCIDDSFEKIYAIARHNSKVNAFQFRRFCQRIGVPIKLASRPIKQLFNEQLIEAVFSVEEFAFDADRLRAMLKERLQAAQVEFLFNISVQQVASGRSEEIVLQLDNGERLIGGQVFNCTYSQINTLLHHSGLPLLAFKHEVAELGLIDVPEPLKKLGITVMDGPFFSTMPFPARRLHSLSHVRYTPRDSWQDLDAYRDAHSYFEQLAKRPNALFMLKDAQRYLPLLGEARYIESLFEVKTVLMQNEIDDGRPILFRKDYGLKNFSIIMGGKIDNIYDILQALKASGLISHTSFGETAPSAVVAAPRTGF